MNIEQAEQATRAICANVESALAALRHPITVNGYGVLVDPRDELTALQRAHEELGEALHVYAATSWPNPSDTEANA
ncbi:hypothetical protein AB7849_11550 [Rhodanobacter sp. 115]|uniref:hypothetical protein n=1 Tax=Rhodanobacter sp. FW021-MT20 TaxID=1162282 RepID=UPI000260D253|nr:hypothetical protein [Rhodanobacter sp. 115]EIL98229.1 hypothetical protein UU5_03957 [Rhodanobacter sp. 115]